MGWQCTLGIKLETTKTKNYKIGKIASKHLRGTHKFEKLL